MCVCETMNRAKTGQYNSFRLFSWKAFTWLTRNVVDKHVGATFVAPKLKLRFLTILLKSFLWFHISLALYAHRSYFQICEKYGHQRAKFWSILDPKVSKNSGFGHFLKKLPSVLVYMSNWVTFRGVLNIGHKGPISGSSNIFHWSLIHIIFYPLCVFLKCSKKNVRDMSRVYCIWCNHVSPWHRFL